MEVMEFVALLAQPRLVAFLPPMVLRLDLSHDFIVALLASAVRMGASCPLALVQRQTSGLPRLLHLTHRSIPDRSQKSGPCSGGEATMNPPWTRQRPLSLSHGARAVRA